jgi:hypothetical protein
VSCNKVSDDLVVESGSQTFYVDPTYVYFASCEPGYLKIGCSGDPPDRVLRTLQAGITGKRPEDAKLTTLKFIGGFRGDRIDERRWHRYFSQFKIVGEWFRYDEECQKRVSWIRMVRQLNVLAKFHVPSHRAATSEQSA